MNATFNVDGMTGEECKDKVQNSLRKLSGVDDVQVRLNPGKAEVSYDDSKVTIVDITNAIEHEGYTVTRPEDYPGK